MFFRYVVFVSISLLFSGAAFGNEFESSLDSVTAKWISSIKKRAEKEESFQKLYEDMTNIIERFLEEKKSNGGTIMVAIIKIEDGGEPSSVRAPGHILAHGLYLHLAKDGDKIHFDKSGYYADSMDPSTYETNVLGKKTLNLGTVVMRRISDPPAEEGFEEPTEIFDENGKFILKGRFTHPDACSIWISDSRNPNFRREFPINNKDGKFMIGGIDNQVYMTWIMDKGGNTLRQKRLNLTGLDSQVNRVIEY